MRIRAAILASSVSVGLAAGAADVSAVKACIEENTPRTSTVQKIALAVQADGVDAFESTFTLFWQRLSKGERRILLRFHEPEDLEGAGLLVKTKARGRPRVHVYLPDLGKPRRVSSRGDLEGFLGRANLGVAELELLLDPLGGRDSLLRDGEAALKERSVWTVEQRSADRDSRFPRAVTFVDREYCVPLRAELYDDEDVRRKVLDIEPASMTRVRESWVPRSLVFHDLLDGSDTQLRVEEVIVDAEFSPSRLSVDVLSSPALPRLGPPGEGSGETEERP